MFTTPNMNLPVSEIGIDSGETWESNLNSALSLIDAHDHSPGKGVPVSSNSFLLSTDLPLNNNSLTLVKSIRFKPQPSTLSGPQDIGALYETGIDLWFNDGNGNKVQVTRGGGVNATSSGISSPPASAFFVSSVLVVNANTSTPANIQGASLLLGNNTLNSKFLTLSPPPAMAADYTITLPALPASQKILTLDNAGNMVAAYDVDNSTTTINANVIKIKDLGIAGLNIATSTITIDKRVPVPSTSGGLNAGLGQILQIASNAPFVHAPGGVNISSGTIVTAGRPIKILVQPQPNTGLSYSQAGSFANSSETQFQILVDGQQYNVNTRYANLSISPPILYVTPSAMQCVSNVGAGTHTITLRAYTGPANGSNVNLVNCDLIAYEM